jgi:hypothetical protein
MSITRKTHKTKIYSDPSDQANSPWVEVERTDELTVETGRGHDYQKTVYKFNWPQNADGTDDESATQDRKVHPLTVTIGGGGSGSVDINIIDEIKVETGRGHDYQKTTYKFDNSAGNDRRRTHTKTIYASDGSGSVDVEIIDSWVHEQGRGYDYQASKFQPNWPNGAGQ